MENNTDLLYSELYETYYNDNDTNEIKIQKCSKILTEIIFLSHQKN